jgi:hypothetical protein
MNAEAGVSRAESGFDMNRKEWFVNAHEFAKQNITSPDTLDFHYRAMKILQELTKTHLNQLLRDPLIDLDIKRLRFLYHHATVDQQDTIYIAALRNMAREYAKFPEATQALYEIASVYERYGYEFGLGADPSKKLAPPYPTRSTINASCAGEHAVDPPLQATLVVEFARITLPVGDWSSI